MKGQWGSSDFKNRVPQRPEGLEDDGARRDPGSAAGDWQPSDPAGDGWSGTDPAVGAPKDSYQAGRSAEGRPRDPDDETARRHNRGLWKVLALLGVGCLGVNMLLGALAMSALSLSLASCMSSCSDNPVGDSREDAAFIAAHEASARDLQVFDALRGSFESVYTRVSNWSRAGEEDSDEPAEYPMTVDELRSLVAAGTWPTDPVGYGDVDSSHSPQLWVRLAELAQDYLEDCTGERWEVVDFSYPFPDNGPIPVPAVRDENSFAITRLRCTEGEDEGLYLSVRYYRWVTPAYYEYDLGQVREDYAERQELLEKVGETGLLGERRYLLDNGDLLVWEEGPDDALRDPDAFVEMAAQMADLLGDYEHITLVAADMPATLAYRTIAYEFRNDKPDEVVPFEEARERLQLGGPAYSLDHARGDELLSVYRRPNEELTVDDLSGTLAPNGQDDFNVPTMRPDEGSVFDEGLAALLAGVLDVPDASQVIALSEFESKSYNSESDYADDSMHVWVVVPRGAMPETPEGFCQSLTAVRDLVWDQIEVDSAHRTSLALRICMVDEEGILDPSGDPCSFAQLREALAQDPTSLGDYTLDVLLGAMPYSALWENESERDDYGCSPGDVGGSIARSRAWHYGA